VNAPFLRVTWTDPVTGREGHIVIDRLVRGLAGGGTRLRAGCTVEEVERLARAMSYKNGALQLPVGGAKAGLDVDPHDPEAVPMLTRFVRAMYPIFSTYMGTGEDLGTSQEMLVEVFSQVGLGTPIHAVLRHSADPAGTAERLRRALGVRVDGVGLVDLVGGYGVAEAAAAAAELAGARVSVQGFGSMGGSAARYLAAKGARIVCVADAGGCVINPDGLDVEALLGSRSPYGDLDRSRLRATDREAPREAWLGVDSDVLVPAAVADVIDEHNCDLVKAKLVVEAANIPTTGGAERRLHERGVKVIPDFVANAGTNAWFWWLILEQLEPSAEAAFERIATSMRTTVGGMLDLARRDSITPREAALKVSIENLDRLAEKLGVEGPLLVD